MKKKLTHKIVADSVKDFMDMIGTDFRQDYIEGVRRDFIPSKERKVTLKALTEYELAGLMAVTAILSVATAFYWFTH